MTKIYSKYFCMFTITMISLGLFNAGCTYQPKRTVALETKMDTLSHSVKSLAPEIDELKYMIDAQEAEVEATLNAQVNANKLLEKRVLETVKKLQEIKLNLELVEEDSDKMEVQLNELGIQLDRLESLTKISSAETNLTEELLDDAIKLYRQQEFEEAISKWEEVLSHDPGKLDTKFHIEIAKDRIREKQIHEELKALLIQRK